MKRLLLVIVTVLILSLLISCGGGKKSVPPAISVRVSPASTSLDQGATLQLSAVVTGSDSGVKWSIQEPGGGSITPSGLYTAPATSATFHIIATSIADTTKHDFAVVFVPEVLLQVSHSALDMEPSTAQQLTANVSGTVNTAVNWGIQEGTAGGNISDTGLYSAPVTAGSYHVVATSAADPTKQVYVPVSVAQLAVAVYPRAAVVPPGHTMTFEGSVAGCMDDRVSWAVQEGAAGGTVNSNGSYTAPMTKGEYHLIATSTAHPLISSVATIKIAESGFTLVGNMTHSRGEHTATLLPSGDVVLTGGYYNEGDGWGYASATAEVFDHVTHTFRSTGEMTTPRVAHTATLLPNGKVLIAGGSWGGWFEAINTAELYDPTTGTFSSAGTLVQARGGHTATLLPNGKVLLAGGETDAAELYDPATGSFHSVAPMKSARTNHTATLLQDGRVLVLGGGAPPETYAELYDPSTESFSTAAPMTDDRYWQTATLLNNGNVLVLGGSSPNDWLPCTLETAAMFDGKAKDFSLLSEKPYECRVLHTATLLTDGTVLIAGGFGKQDEALLSAELFHPATNSFIAIAPMQVARGRHSATLLQDGSVLIAGGTNDTSAEIYKAVP